MARLPDDRIVDAAAALFARRGLEQTSVQAVADAVGLSKAGLLHHFPSKDALRDAVVGQAAQLGQQALGAVLLLPLGARRDRRGVEVLVDIALAHPGLVALLLAPVGAGAPDLGDPALDGAADAALQVFGVDDGSDLERRVRVVGALGGLAVLTLAATSAGEGPLWRPYVVAASSDALGHPRPALRPDLEA